MSINKIEFFYLKSKILGRLTGIKGVLPPFSLPSTSLSKALVPLQTATAREDIADTYASGNVDVSLRSIPDDVSYFLVNIN